MSHPYHEVLHRLLHVNISGGMKLGLQNCLQLDALLSHPSKAFPAIHIAGTNGKGSVSTKIAAAYQAMGLKTGLYTSPHIACFRERIRINGIMITEEQMLQHLSTLFAISDEKGIKATFFELTTMLAFLFFAAEKVDIAVLETGLGGRLDATNIANPILSMITSISLEHTEILGNTIEAITREKAGIIKPNIPILIGPRVPQSLIEEVASEKGSLVIRVEGTFPDYHAENCALAKKALEWLKVPEDAMEKGLKALPPCRLETFTEAHFRNVGYPAPWPLAIVLDVAHNPDGLTQLLHALRLRYPGVPLRLVLGLSSNKDILGCLEVIKEQATAFHLVEGKNGRATSTTDIKKKLQDLSVDESRIFCEPSIVQAIHHASQIAGHNHEVVVTCGTFFIMGEARQALGIREPQDPHDMNERKITNV